LAHDKDCLTSAANDHLLLLIQSYRTVFQTILHLLHHWQCFNKNWKQIYFSIYCNSVM